MQRISVEHTGGDVYCVRVEGATEHTVTARAQVVTRVARSGEAVEATLRRAFEFLLAREPASSILRRFDLEDIARYFPEFWSSMA